MALRRKAFCSSWNTRKLPGLIPPIFRAACAISAGSEHHCSRSSASEKACQNWIKLSLDITSRARPNAVAYVVARAVLVIRRMRPYGWSPIRMSRASQALHLGARFFSSLKPKGPCHEDETWASAQLLELERELWVSMSNVDRRHGVAVARRVVAALGPKVTRPVLAAALLHDVGKTTAGLGTFGRVVATLAIAAAGRRRAETWNKGFRRRIALYSRHTELGADLLAVAESDPLTVAWAREHHRPEEACSVPVEIGRVLRDADEG